MTPVELRWCKTHSVVECPGEDCEIVVFIEAELPPEEVDWTEAAREAWWTEQEELGGLHPTHDLTLDLQLRITFAAAPWADLPRLFGELEHLWAEALADELVAACPLGEMHDWFAALEAFAETKKLSVSDG